MKCEAVIFDWAGTTVDYGCFAPVQAFMEIFRAYGIEPTMEETRRPMGMLKWDHIKTMLQMERIGKEFRRIHGRDFTDADVDAMHNRFQEMLLGILDRFSDPKDYVRETVEALRRKGIRIGSTTGYTDVMMEIVTREAAKRGYEPDCWFSPDSVQHMGRPYPYMIFRNMEMLRVASVKNVIKVGDTISDIKEGRNAGVFTVGIVEGSSEMGLTKEEYEALDDETREQMIRRVTDRYMEAGADRVIRDIRGVLQLEIPMEINEYLAEMAFENGVPVMLNSAPSAPLSDSLLSHLAFISPNEHEAEDLTGIPIRREGDHVNLEDARAAAEALREKGVQNVLITLGSGGAVLLGPDGFVHSPCVEGITAVDPTAAGDSFVGAFCVGTCCGWTNQELLQFANHTAALTVSAMGAMPSLPSLEKVERFMAQKNILLPDISVLK